MAATTYRDIAERADVGIGTVYHHFPTYDGVIAACSRFHFERLALPGPDLFDGITGLRRRLRVLVALFYDRYARMAAYPRVRGERSLFPALHQGLLDVEQAFVDLVGAALRPLRCGVRKRTLAVAILDYGVYERLMASGLSRNEAVGEITSILLRTVGTKGSPK